MKGNRATKRNRGITAATLALLALATQVPRVQADEHEGVQGKGIHTTQGEHSILGRTLVIHAGADDGSQPTGNAAPRIAVGVIGFKNPSLKDVFHLGTEKVEETAEKAAGGIERLARKVGEVAEDTAETVEEKARRAKNRIERKIRD